MSISYKLKEKNYHLISKHQHSLKGELAFAVIEQIFETGAQKIDNHYVVIALNAKPVNIWDTHYIIETKVSRRFINCIAQNRKTFNSL